MISKPKRLHLAGWSSYLGKTQSWFSEMACSSSEWPTVQRTADFFQFLAPIFLLPSALYAQKSVPTILILFQNGRGTGKILPGCRLKNRSNTSAFYIS
jgi:hypothetical protein